MCRIIILMKLYMLEYCSYVINARFWQECLCNLRMFIGSSTCWSKCIKMGDDGIANTIFPLLIRQRWCPLATAKVTLNTVDGLENLPIVHENHQPEPWRNTCPSHPCDRNRKMHCSPCFSYKAFSSLPHRSIPRTCQNRTKEIGGVLPIRKLRNYGR